MKKCEKSPIKLLIPKCENMKVENEFGKNIVQCVQSMETECGPSGADESCAKADYNVASSQLVINVPIVSCAKPTGEDNLSSMVISKQKKMV